MKTKNIIICLAFLLILGGCSFSGDKVSEMQDLNKIADIDSGIEKALVEKRSEQVINEDDLTVCKSDDDCIIVPFDSCCGSTKKAINKKYLKEYNKKSDWQKFDDLETCSVIGVCLSDENVDTAYCSDNGRCQLKYN